MSVPESILSDVLSWSTFRLASEAGITCPDSSTSAGAEWLSSILSATVEAVTYVDDDDLPTLHETMSDAGTLSEVADGAVPVYTHALWATFVDVAAYNVDTSDFGSHEESDMTRQAQIALYILAESAIGSILDSIGSELSDRIDVGIGRASERGTSEGSAMASWVIDGNTDVATIRAILAGIDDGDPMVMDSLPSADLSGQHADVTTVADLLADADLSGLSSACQIGQDMADAYEESFNAAVEDEVSRMCRAHLSD